MSSNSPFNPFGFSSATSNTKNISSIDPNLSRTNYYDGRLLKASDLIRDQLYLDERLREVGKVLGQGVVRGLDLGLTEDGVLTVSPGLAVAASGRVLELENTTLSVNLLERDKIAAMNEGFRYLHRGLYAVVLQYAEEGRGSAEIYPRDLEAERGFHFNAFAEGVELVLTPLRNRLPYARQHDYHRLNNSVLSRSALVKELLIPNRDQPVEISEDGIALGLIAVEHGRPLWLDRGLLRRPHRNPQALYALQSDLNQHYEELLADVLQLRQQSIRQNSFPASHYFDLLPPFGTLPKDCIDPVNGYQTYFPNSFEVSISPVRLDDLNAIFQQSLPLEPIDFSRDKDVDIMVLVPMDDNNFAFRARQLQHVSASGDSSEFVLPPHFDDYQLRAYGQKGVHAENTDSAVWADIWSSTSDIYFVRRPTRVAETQVSAVVLATGDYEDIAHITSLPPSMEDMADQIEQMETTITNLQAQVAALQTALDNASSANAELIASLNQQIQSLNVQINRYENQIEELSNQLLLNRTFIRNILEQNEVNLPGLEELFELRPGETDAAIEAQKELQDAVGDDISLLSQVHQLMLIMPQKYDELNWRTLAELFRQEQQKELMELIAPTTVVTFLDTMRNNLNAFDISEELRIAWQQLGRITIPLIPGIPVRPIPAPVPTPVITNPVPVLPNLDNITIRPVDSIIAVADTEAVLSAENTERLKAAVADNPDLLTSINKLDAVVDDKYKAAMITSLPTLVENNNVDEFLAYAVKAKEKGLPLGVTVGATNTAYKLNAATRRIWTNADLEQ